MIIYDMKLAKIANFVQINNCAQSNVSAIVNAVNGRMFNFAPFTPLTASCGNAKNVNGVNLPLTPPLTLFHRLFKPLTFIYILFVNYVNYVNEGKKTYKKKYLKGIYRAEPLTPLTKQPKMAIYLRKEVLTVPLTGKKWQKSSFAVQKKSKETTSKTCVWTLI